MELCCAALVSCSNFVRLAPDRCEVLCGALWCFVVLCLCRAVLCGAVSVSVLCCVVLCCVCAVLCGAVLCGAVLCCVVLVLKSIGPPIHNCGPPNFHGGGARLSLLGILANPLAGLPGPSLVTKRPKSL